MIQVFLKNRTLVLVFLIALLLRIGLVFSAYHGDLNNNISWGQLAAERGFGGFYGSEDADDWPYSAPNQPPLTILTFAGLAHTYQFFDSFFWKLNTQFSYFPSKTIWFWEDWGMILLIKLPSVIADLGIAYLIYNYFVGKRKQKLGLTLSFVWLFNPITWYNSAVWGQTDSIVNFLGLAALFLLLSKKLITFSALFSLSLLFKGSLAIFAPVFFVIALIQKHKFNLWTKAAFAFVTPFIVLSFPFHPHADIISWIIELYRHRILPGEIGYLTANAFNFWWLIDSGKTLDSQVFLGLSARIWGFIIAFPFFAYIIAGLRHKHDDKKIFLSLALSALITFLFLTRIHERYLYPFFPPATMLLGFMPNLYLTYAVLSLSHLLNLYHLFWAPPLSWLESLYKFSFFPNFLAVVNISVFLHLLKLQAKKN